MTPAGLREIERAKEDGRWNAAYPPQSKASVPDDLWRALENNPAASKFFLTLNSVNRYAILHRIHNAKMPATRASRIEKFVAMLSRGETIHPSKKK
ncbi:MAG TPA: YdeI/OmpD-associated family protein [Acidisarcina sp.]